MTSTASAARFSVRASDRRDDLDGLRMFAVLLVAVYHVWIGRVSGGVDIFLLLSGFFVGGGIVRACLRGDFAFAPFLARTARRLLPSLLVVLLVTLAATVVTSPVPRWSEAARQTLASAFYVENWYLVEAGRDYGAASVVDSPYQHLWSMSVQGQLFVGIAAVAVITLALLRKRGVTPRPRAALIVIVAVCVASLAWATIGVVADPVGAYFDTAGRGWEFLIGTVLALITDRNLYPRAELIARVRPAVGTVFAWGGVVAILCTGPFIDGAELFPGPAALVPLGGAAMLILFREGRWSPARFFAWRPFAAAGIYAYAFYLWHWPVLVFLLRLRDGEQVGWLAGSGVIAVSALLAWATVRFVDRHAGATRVPAPREAQRPVRGDAVPRRLRLARLPLPTMVIVASLVIALPAAWLAHVEIGRAQLGQIASDLDRYPGASVVAYPGLFSWDPSDGRIPSIALAAEDKPMPVGDGCNAIEDEVVVCSYGDLTATRVLAVVGGSHTEQWVDVLATLGEETGFRVDTMIKWSCELVDGKRDVEFFEDVCVSWSANALDELLAERPDAVFTTATRPSNVDDGRREMIPRAYERAWERLASAGIRTLAIRDNPWTGSDPVGCVAESETPELTCGVARADVLDESPPVTRTDADELRLSMLDLTDVLCSAEWCSFVEGGRLIYRDDHHLTNTWAMSTAPILRDRLLPLLGW